MKYIKGTSVIFLLMVAVNYLYSQDVIDPTTLNNKVMAGYQGWFAAEGDGSGVGWRHWGRGGDTPGPGANKTFTFDVSVPNTASVYNFQWRMLQEGVNWFGDISPNRVVNVSGNPSFLDDCDALTDWNSSVSLQLNPTEKMQGVNSIEFDGSSADEYSKAFTPAYNSDITANNAVLQFWYYISDASMIGTSNQIELGSAGIHDVDEYNWKKNGRVSTGWNGIRFMAACCR